MTATQEPMQLFPAGEGGLYKFLDYFEEKDESTFAGRDRNIQEIAARIMVDRTLVLYGRSGLGKTSLILAGLFPELRRRELIPVYCRVLQNPRSDVEESLREALHIADPERLAETLQENKVVLVLDQFEEFFVRFDKKPVERQALIDLLKELLGDAKSGLRVLISLREDYLARLDELKEQLLEFFGTDYRLGQLTAFGARQAITRPLAQKGIRYEPKLVSQILEIISAEDFDSLLLQLICTAVASEADRCGRPEELLAEDLKAVGGLDGILGRYLNAAMSEIPDDLRVLTRTMLDALITNENTKRAITLAFLLRWDTEAKPEQLRDSLNFLKEKKLVREERRGTNNWLELSHERLVNPILRWFETDRTFADFRFAREMVANGFRSWMYRTRFEALLTKEALDNLIGPFRDRLRLDEKQIEFLFWSAVYGRSNEAKFWANRLDLEACRSVMMDFFKSPDAAARAGAAHFAFLFPGSAAAERCLRLALIDPVEEVRREASQTLTRIAGPQEISELRAALGQRATKRRALEALACFPEDSKCFRKFAWISRVFARRIARQRLIAASGNQRAAHVKLGALSGLISSIIWAFTFLPLIICLVSWNSGTAEYLPLLDSSFLSDSGVVFAIGVPIMVLVSVAIGVAVGWGTAKVAVLSKPFGWWRACLYLFLVSGSLLTTFFYLAFRTRDLLIMHMMIRDSWAICLFASLIAVLHIRFGSSGMLSSASSIVRRWTIGLFYCTVPFLIAGTIGLIASVAIGEKKQDWFIAGVITGALWSVVFYAWSTSLVESALPAVGMTNDRLRLLGARFSGPTSLVAVALSAICYLLAFGPASIPIFAETATLENAGFTIEPHSFSLHRVPTAVFFTVGVSQNATPAYEAVGVPDDIDLRFGNAVGRIFFLPPGRRLGNVSYRKFEGGWTGNRFTLKLKAVPILDGQTVPATQQYQTELVTLRKDTSGGQKQPPVWIGQVSGQVVPISDSWLEIVPLIEQTEYRAPSFATTGVLTASGERLFSTQAPKISSASTDISYRSMPRSDPRDLNASVAIGSTSFAFADVSSPWDNEHHSWVIRSQSGHVDVRLTFRFGPCALCSPFQLDQPDHAAIQKGQYSKDQIDRLPSQIFIVVALRAVQTR